VHGWDTIGDGRSISGVTVGGSATTSVVNVVAHNAAVNDTDCGIFQIVTASTSANIVVTFTAAAVGCGIDVYRLNNLTSTTAFASGSNTNVNTASLSATLNIPANGILIHGASLFSTVVTATITGSGSTQDHTQTVPGDADLAEWTGSAQNLASQTPRTISNTFSPSGCAAIVGASWN
jgi:hypothetical protein